MELHHRFTVPAPVDVTWAAFNDLEQVAPCFPGASLTSVEGDEFAGTVKVKLGPISMQYSGTGTFLERDEAGHRARFEAKGKDKRGNGTAAATVTAVLSAEGDETAVEVTTDLAITGKPAQFGRGVIQDVSDKLLGRFTACLADTLGGPGESAGSAEDSAAVAAAEAPSSSSAGMESTAPAPESPAETAPAAAPGAESARPAPTRTSSPPPADDEGLDLFRTIAPVLARRYAAPALGVLVVLVVLVRLIRRR